MLKPMRGSAQGKEKQVSSDKEYGSITGDSTDLVGSRRKMGHNFEAIIIGSIVTVIYLLYSIVRSVAHIAKIAEELTAIRVGSNIPTLGELIKREIKSEMIRNPQ
jgi:hypothetical protein